MSIYTKVVFKHTTADDLLKSDIWEKVLELAFKDGPLSVIEMGEADEYMEDNE